MLLEGHVENGHIVLDEPANLPEGTKVRVEVISSLEAIARRVEAARNAPETNRTLAERLASVIGTAADLPTDLAQRHDDYIHGADR